MIWWDGMPQGSEVSPFTIMQSIRHDFAYVRRRLGAPAGYRCPGNLELLESAHTQRGTHKTSTRPGCTQNRLGWVSPSLLQAGLRSTHCERCSVHIAGEKYHLGSCLGQIVNTLISYCRCWPPLVLFYSPFDWLVITNVVSRRFKKQKNKNMCLPSRLAVSSERCGCEGRSTENKLGGFSAHSAMLEDEKQRRVSPPTCRVGSWKANSALIAAGAILCLWLAFGAHEEVEVEVGVGGGGLWCNNCVCFSESLDVLRLNHNQISLAERGSLCWSMLPILICTIIKIRKLKSSKWKKAKTKVPSCLINSKLYIGNN